MFPPRAPFFRAAHGATACGPPGGQSPTPAATGTAPVDRNPIDPVARGSWDGEDGPVLIILLLGFAPWVIVLTLAIALYLTVIELLELRPNYGWWIWWLLLVFLTHFVGYLILRVYSTYHRHREAAGP